jgi:hypothetical protein
MSNLKLDEFYIRLYHGDPHDEAIVEHLQQFDRAPRGTKHDEAKRLMYLGVQTLEQEGALDTGAARRIAQDAARRAVESASPRLDQVAVRQAVQEAMQGVERDFGLGDIRRVVEAALNQYLDRLQLAEPGEAVEERDVADEARVEESLERLGESLLH